MRIGLLTEYPLSQRAGWQSSVRRMRDALEARGHEVRVLFQPPESSSATRLWRRLRRRPGLAPLTDSQLDQGARHADMLASDCDLVLAVMGSRLLVRMQTATPVALVSDATWSLLQREYQRLSRPNEERDRLERRVLARADHHIYSSEWARRSAVEDYGVLEDRTVVIPLGANLEPTYPVGPWLPPSPSTPCELLFVGRDWQRKRGDLAVQVLHELLCRLVPARLTLVGEPPAKLPSELTERVRNLGWLEIARARDERRYREAFQDAHFLLLPTAADCTPIVCAEASAFGVPVLASDVGGVSAMVEPAANGMLFTRDATPGEYADWIEATWRDAEGYVALRRRCADHHRAQLSWDCWAATVDACFAELSHQRQPDRADCGPGAQ